MGFTIVNQMALPLHKRFIKFQFWQTHVPVLNLSDFIFASHVSDSLTLFSSKRTGHLARKNGLIYAQEKTILNLILWCLLEMGGRGNKIHNFLSLSHTGATYQIR